MGIGERIKAAREKTGMTQVELGKKVGVSGVAIMRYEKGQRQPRLDQLIRIAVALGVQWTELVPGNNKAAYVIKNSGKVFPTPKDRINVAVGKLNEDGQEKVAELAEDLAEIPRYQATSAPQSTPAPQEGKEDTTPAETPLQRPQEGEE